MYRNLQGNLGESLADNSLNDIDNKRWVWISHPETAFTKAWIKEELPDGKYVVRYNNSRDQKVVSHDEMQPLNPARFDRVNDMAELTNLNEPSVTYNLEQRYLSDQIYTYSGLFLVAVNPYRRLPIYGKDMVQLYKDKSQERKLPHVFAIADLAYNNLLENKENQSILVTGESGAGKTENTKRIIQYLASVASNPHVISGEQLEEQILKTNPVLESFGNAKTVRNNNSSRFGKFIKVEFSISGEIANASIEWYLLEKSRVVHQSSQERNYHIFYQLLIGADSSLRKKLLLSNDFNDYEYLKNSSRTIPGINDAEEFKGLLSSLKILGFSEKEMLNLFSIISIILHIGNISIGADRSGVARLTNMDDVDKLCHLLGVSPELFSQNLIRPRIRAGHEWVVSARSQEHVISSVEALAKAIYERNFGWLVKRINTAISRSTSSNTFIGILDIAGFEIFETNSFEQLCINYTNERLQQFFNHHMFVLEQEEYMKEEIKWDFVDFGHDLQPTIDLIEKSNPIGILSCLDEECVMPKATDATFVSKLDALWKDKSPKYRPFKFAGSGFILTHYAADVPYSTEGWLEKNSDPLNENIAKLLAHSTNKHISELFSDYQEVETKTVRGRTRKALFRTVAQRHKEQLNQLMNQFNTTQPHFIRCIVPNEEKKSHSFNRALVLDQLRCNGVLEGIRITRAGFPNRMPFNDFRLRYEMMANLPKDNYIESRRASLLILQQMGLSEDQFRIGVSKIFFKAGVLASLEERRLQTLQKIVTTLQVRIRGFVQRRKYQKRLKDIESIKQIQANLLVYDELRKQPWTKLYFKLRPMLSSTHNDEQLKRRDAEIIELKYEIKKLTNAKEGLETKVNESTKSYIALENALTSERAIALDKEEILRRTQGRLASLEDSNVSLNATYKDMEVRLADILNEKEVESKHMEEVREALESMSSQNEKRKEDNDKLRKELDTFRMYNEEVKSALSAAKVEIASITKQKNTVDRDIGKLREDDEKKNNELSSLLQENSALKDELHKLIELSKSLEEKLTNETNITKNINSSVENMSSELGRNKLEKSEMANDISILKQQNQELEVLKGVQQMTIETLEQKVNYLEADVKQVSQLKKELGALTEKDNIYKVQSTRNKELEESVKTHMLTLQKLEGNLKDANNKLAKLQDFPSKYEELVGQTEDLHRKNRQLEKYKFDYETQNKELLNLRKVQTDYHELMVQHNAVTRDKEQLEKSNFSTNDQYQKLLEERSDLTQKVESLTRQLDSALQKLPKIPLLENEVSKLKQEFKQTVKELEEEKQKAVLASQDNEQLRSLKKELQNKRQLETNYQKLLEEVKTTRSLRSEVSLLRNKASDVEYSKNKLTESELKLKEVRKELNSALEVNKKKDAELHRLKEHKPAEKENKPPASFKSSLPERKTIFDLQQRNANQTLFENLKRDYDRLNLEKQYLEKQMQEGKKSMVTPQATGGSLERVAFSHAVEVKALKDQINSEKSKIFAVQYQSEKREKELQKSISELEKQNRYSLIDVRALRDRIASLEEELMASSRA
ncbi:myosin II heavy chain [Schizosaccharomyces cryophilus OY26]|uniref:Myosin II heavy chain n=1 Tax=Schizosaccharomyces cryophilus (strain OY26 / ATCC MYA-4695 / CBS 11777 / NBRC 106824 / NRRL Y48691) TaxID=653667 RepID=S9X0U8_SCHCR|nr:myosin II heavy chain [Schizosaccharomyces cryophilus OY26]EPY50612.1 myosin II heavy chain [Schizosaccharomyces cryophilus OY26]